MNGDFRDLIKKAMGIESKMAEFYGKMARRPQLRKPARCFKILAGEEEEHRVLLANYLEEGAFPQVSPVGEADLAPTLKVVASITDDMGPFDALAFAIRSEEYQHQFYKKLSLAYPPGWTQNFLKRLADMELVHKEKVEKLHRWLSRVQDKLVTAP